MNIALLITMLAGPIGGAMPAQLDSYLKTHSEYRLLRSTDTAGCSQAEHTSMPFPSVITADFTTDHVDEVAAVLVTKSQPRKFGVVVFGGRTRSATQWVVKSSPAVLTGVSAYNSPFGVWLLVGGCAVGERETFVWDGRAFQPSPVY